ncbi:TrkH family potassium uptake protein [Pleurocapsa sp. PCC 7319]|uniref:TrkH family potassium uptake protein n=1 Tax=Pleurocapsa sp. PCC 7319 TaxID=118161 RepID=UPI000344A4F1|nr:TrkH family potassium uptake protein [Pleurocapsa sp. PCC 7319]
MLLERKKTNRYSQFLRQRYRAILGYTGLICAIAGVVMLSPLLALIFYPEEIGLAWGFALPGIFLTVVGGLLWRFLVPKKVISLSLSEGSVIVVLAWLLAIAFGTIPFMLIQGLNFPQAAFESTSGWTTTGLSVVDVTQASRLILLYRSNIELAGGGGFAIIALSAISGLSGAGLTSAEGRSEQLAPNVRRSAKLVLSIYSGYAVVGILALWLAGMGWFDAVNHSFAALSTGGFSTRTDSIGYWDSPAVEAVTIVLMILGTLNFLTSYFLLRGKFKPVVRNGEVRLMALVIPLCAVIVFFGVAVNLYETMGKSVRVAIFEMITALSTTGFSTVGYGDWNSLGWTILIILMLIGGGTGATAGGIKQFRIYALYRALLWEVKRMLQPKNTVTEPDYWQGDRRSFLDDSQIRTIALFVFLYFLVFFVGVIITAAYGNSLPDSLFEYASSLSTVGLSIGVTSSDAPVGLIWTQIVGMFLGRLEFFTVFVGIIRLFKDLPAVFFGK